MACPYKTKCNFTFDLPAARQVYQILIEWFYFVNAKTEVTKVHIIPPLEGIYAYLKFYLYK
jgi:hypothetical protein